MSFKTKAEKIAFKKGLFYGLFQRKKKKVNSNKKQAKKHNNSAKLKEMHKRYRDRNLGALQFNGKIYDTNFKDGPVEITKDEIKKLRPEYDIHNQMSDIEVADCYVRHMRKKYGMFERGTGKWLGLMGDE